MKKIAEVMIVVVLFVVIGCHGGGSNGNVDNSNNNDAVTGVIGADGGSLTTPSGNTTLDVPTGALANNVTISVSQNVGNDSLGAMQLPYEFGPTGLSFGTPATVTFKYEPASLSGLDENQLKVAYESGGQYIPIDNSVVDTTNHTVTAPVSHFSGYGLSCYDNALNTSFGNLNGVVAYSNNHCAPTSPTDPYYSYIGDCHYKHSDGPLNSVGTHVTGEKWQCVEYVSRYYWLIYNHDILLSSSNDASTFWENIPDGTADSRGLIQYSNGGSAIPQAGDIIVFKGNTSSHVAIVRGITDSAVHIIQQNVYLNFNDADYVLNYHSGTNYLETFTDKPALKVLGWLRMPSVAVNINGIALGVLVNSSTGKVVINNMIFDKANLTLHIMGDDGYYSYGSQSPYQISGTALNANFSFFDTSSGNWFPAEINGTVKSSSLAAGDWLVNSSLVGNFEIDFIGVAMTSPSCSNFTYPLTLFNYGGSNLSITIAQKYSSSMLIVSSGNANIHTGNGWINGNQVFVNFIDTSDSANMKTTLLRGTMSADCLSATGTWSSHIFGSVAEIATGTWQLTR